ncbi:MAG: class A beta-lactamase-related serine hydrolase [Candidatus Omnitrophica bacterium]|nr:class A beta-lactamase-related serine hydrolase [Candidatus Omnitrophota bacterium]
MMRKIFPFLFLAAAAVSVCAGGILFYSRHQEETRRQMDLRQRRQAWEDLRRQAWGEIRRFQGEAGVVIEDLDTGWVMGHQHDRVFASASLVKVPLMVACYQAAREGRIRLSDTITLRGSDKVSGSGSLKAKPSGSRFTVEELIGRMITESDNTATNMLIRALGYDYLNGSFRRIGLQNTTLVRRMMDFSQRKNGVENLTTPSDVASVFRQLYSFRLVSEEASKECLEFLMNQTKNDRIPAGLPPQTVVAHKTGLEKGVCHDSGIVFTPKGNLLICVLTENGKASPPAKKFIARLASLAYKYKTE